MRSRGGSEFAEFVAGSSRRLLGLAYLLSADRAAAERLLEDALGRTYRHWSSVSRGGVPEAHVRQLLVDAVRRGRRRRRLAGTADAGGASLMPVVAALPTGQRVVLVLRYFEGLDEAQAAAVMGWSVNTVRSQYARAIARVQASRSDRRP